MNIISGGTPAAGKFLVFLLCALLCGCGAKSVQRPQTIKAIQSENSKGLAALEQGYYDKASTYFRESLRLSASVENIQGMTVALINLSRLYRNMGDINTAETFIDSAFEETNPNDIYYPELAFEKAAILLSRSQLQAAEKWAYSALEHGGISNKAALLNLLARIHFLQEDDAEADSRAQQAQASAQDNWAEVANSYYLRGLIAQRQQDFELARSFYQRALSWDKKAALSKKVYRDLTALAELARAEGDTANERSFLLRAHRVAVNGEDHVLTEEIDTRLQTLDQNKN